MLQLRGGGGRPRASLSSYRAASSTAPSESTDATEILPRTEVLERWNMARFQLARATQNYITACAAIEADCGRPSTSFLDECALEETFVSINAELSSLAMDEQRLWRARATLKGLRNRSSVLTPVNLLPPEILTQIFIIAVEADRANRAALAQKFQGEDEKNPLPRPSALRRADLATVISSVNIYWRRLATRTRELWSHIDLGESGARTDAPFARAKLWLERARGAPLYVTINTTGNAAKIIDAWGILPLLRSHETTFRSLDLALNTVDEVHAALARWLSEGAPRSLRSLAISVPYPPKHGDSPHALPPGLLHREQRDAFFEPLRSLDLDGTHLSWGGPAFRGLVDLRLSRLTDKICPSVEQMVTIISGSPALRTLWLRRMTIRVGTRLNFAPVKMNNLEILGLEHIESQGLCLLLPILAPEPQLYVKISAYTRDPGQVGEALTDFFARSKVESLHLNTFVNPAQLPRMLVRLQHLRTFTWHGLNIGDEFFEAMAHNSTTADGRSTIGAEGNNESGGDGDASPAHLCPNLRALNLESCSLAAAALRKLVTNRLVPKLTIAGCHLLEDGTGEEAQQLMSSLEKCLNDSVPDLLLNENSLVIQD
ncbi:F-box-like domain-containing protein [Ceratobasidium theobromae]|uniref:F-box-like domain-containing protein n=1 Tax=Ceratobasidium theobromae TaxID=1582974 RepID=A0A5N5QJQ6_9AGAM|nr:F-box-like domain-containing protein [Ceratobasidium theobromae]